MNRLLRIFVLVVLAAMSGACSNSPPVPEDHFYRLQVNPGVMPAQSPVFADGLILEAVTADPLRSGRAVLYRNSATPLQLQRYHYEYWVDQPPRLVRQVMLDSLRDADLADVLYEEGRHTRARHRIKGRVLRFEKVLGGGRADVEFELEVVVLDEDSDMPLWSKVYLERRMSQDQSMHAAAEAMQQAVAGVMQQLIEDLKGLDVTS